MAWRAVLSAIQGAITAHLKQLVLLAHLTPFNPRGPAAHQPDAPARRGVLLDGMLSMFAIGIAGSKLARLVGCFRPVTGCTALTRGQRSATLGAWLCL
eukprot:6639865-Prymnesium_polylepis.1